jgi:hypothetical protein
MHNEDRRRRYVLSAIAVTGETRTRRIATNLAGLGTDAAVLVVVSLGSRAGLTV